MRPRLAANSRAMKRTIPGSVITTAPSGRCWTPRNASMSTEPGADDTDRFPEPLLGNEEAFLAHYGVSARRARSHASAGHTRSPTGLSRKIPIPGVQQQR
jgi:hypothetical protein